MNFLWLWIALAGAGGTLTRFLLATWVQGAAGPHFPWGTLCVNALGCLLFGFLVALPEEVGPSSRTRMIILTGFMGALTTFSTFSFETVRLATTEASRGLAAGNVAIQLTLGGCMMLLGQYLASFW
ncbi:Fluoride efflux transporter CrcB [Planctomycetales bacterium 10988]|nr:Fluoride efflux transporter CrcB [Planctomycetales bacterium 10988]